MCPGPNGEPAPVGPADPELELVLEGLDAAEDDPAEPEPDSDSAPAVAAGESW
jgi:hypothetical protein